MTIAMKVVDKALEEDFGFEHRLWVYSGRRGVHCWVCDEAARKLSQSSRSAVAEYLSVIKGGENQLKKVNLPIKLHPSLWRASTILESDFKTLLLEKQDILSDKETWKKVLALIPDENVKKNLNLSWEKSQTSKERWKILESEMDKKISNHRLEIIFQYCYPRLDVNVTKGLNHLLKSPFCIHPKTGRVCVPIDITKVDHFDPFTVPTISQLCEEINDICQNTSNDENIPPQNFRGYKSLLLKDAMDVFERFILKLDKENHDRRTRKKESNEKTIEW
ncbi:DNA primase small subunit-like [Xenia sp. Carnegie-2017]|uniref:DNA primase small subunit-like n=1 Tax=Xenia sp. Carnegie-2017 TaxID=2897299 RepID=UPI001F042799|nr:DNA primase small subunit-like [Xenia sp. Carnegie-2017]XP_046859251.1 DNA primase small subunit-like [Xenia sp. Carnegie-2017]